MKLTTKIRRFLRDEDGPTAVEYAVMLAMIIVGCIAAVLSTGDIQKAMFEDSNSALSDSLGH